MDLLHHSEVQDLQEIVVRPEVAGEEIGRLDVPVNESCLMSLGEGSTGLLQERDGPLSRQGTEGANQLFKVQSLQVLHHVVEGARVTDTEVVQLDGVRGSKLCSGLRLALKPLPEVVIFPALPEHIWTDELHSCRPGQELVLSQPHLAHSTATQSFNETVTPD